MGCDLGRDLRHGDAFLRRIDAHCDRRRFGERLKNDAVSLGQLDELLDLFRGRGSIDRERQPDLREPYWSVLGNAQRPTEVEVALRGNGRTRELDAHGGGDRRDPHTVPPHARPHPHVTSPPTGATPTPTP